MEDWSDDEIPFGPTLDPESKVWFAELLFWRPSKLSDEDMQLHFNEWDGRWSEQTKAAVQRFGAKGLDLNENWALSERQWMCPACLRPKPDIFRLTKDGILLAKLELHHDHLRDTIWKRASEQLGPDWPKELPPGSAVLLDYVRDLTCRFSRALICCDCNSAEAEAKKAFRQEIDTRFTFTPSEIRRFVVAKPNIQHEIDRRAVLKLWKSQEDSFSYRVKLIDDLLGQIRLGRLSADRAGGVGINSPVAAFDTRSILLSAFYSEAKDTQRTSLLSNFRAEFLARSTCRDSSRRSPPRQKAKPAGPTDIEFEAYVDPVSPRRWGTVEPSWECPICGRSKRDIVRRSKSNKWSGGVREYTAYADELDEHTISNRARLFPGYPNDKMVGDMTALLVCVDCADVAVRLGQRERSLQDPYLSPEDIRDCLVSVQSHAQHEIDYEQAAARAIENISYGPAAEAFQAYQSCAVDFSSRYDQFIRWNRSEADAIESLAEEVRVFHSIDDLNECRRLAKWLVNEGLKYRS